MEAKANGTRNSPASGANQGIGIYQIPSESDNTYDVNYVLSELCGTTVEANRAGLTTAQITRFLSKIQRGSGCWLWTAARTRNGYGQFHVARVNGKLIHSYAHRLMWRLAHGEIPDGIEVCHRCDVPHCCNPDHLFLGTHADNMADSASKGRKNGPRKRRVYSLDVIEQGLRCKRGELVHLAAKLGFKFRNFYITVRRERLRRQRSLPGKAA